MGPVAVSSEQILIQTNGGGSGVSNGDGKLPGDIVGSTTTTPALGSSSGPAKRKPEDFRFGKLIGEGSFSSVYLAKDVKNGNECAIKVCAKQLIIREKKAELIKREKEVMTILSAHKDPQIPYFVKLHATFQDMERLYFVMTYARGGELLKYIKREPEKLAAHFFDLECCRFYTGELVVALAHLHSLNIIHRDLKPENILLNDKGHILITDFGSAKILNLEKNEDLRSNTNANGNGDNISAQSGDSAAPAPAVIVSDHDQSPRRPPLRRSNSFVGTAQYVSPEVLQAKYTEVGPAADLWALGCILYQLTFGSPPFTATNEYLVFQKILRLGYEFPENVDYSPNARDMIEKLLKLDHKERLGVQDKERYTSLESHPFFDGADIHTFCDRNPTPLYQYLTSDDDVETGEAIHANSYKVPDSFAPGFNPRIMAQRALQDEDDIPFSIPNANSGSNTSTTNTKVENNSVSVVTNTSTTKPSTTTTNDHECKIIHQKDALLNNSKNHQDANSNNDSGCGCKCILF